MFDIPGDNHLDSDNPDACFNIILPFVHLYDFILRLLSRIFYDSGSRNNGVKEHVALGVVGRVVSSRYDSRPLAIQDYCVTIRKWSLRTGGVSHRTRWMAKLLRSNDEHFGWLLHRSYSGLGHVAPGLKVLHWDGRVKYLNIWWEFFKISWMAEAEFRLNLFIRVFSDVIWYIAQLSVFEVVFYHRPQIAGWDMPSMRVFMSILFLVDCWYMVLFQENLEAASSLVRKGELDFLLVKPINSQFMFSFRRVNAVYLINLVIVVAYLLWSLKQLGTDVSRLQIFVSLLLMICGLGILYCLRFFFAGLNILFVNASSLTYVWYQFYRLGTRPHALYPAWLRWAILTVLPVGMIASVPATSLVHGLDWKIAVLSPILSIFLVYLSSLYWNYILKSYASASS